MILERKDLDSLVDRLMKRGLSEEGAKRIVYAYFDATMKVLKDGEELPLLGSKYLYQKREGDKINIYSKKVKEKEFYEKITSAGADVVIGGLAGILGTIKLIYLLRKEGKNKMAKKYEKSKEYAIKQDTLYHLVLRALKICDFTVADKNESDGKIYGRIKWTGRSWGEKYEISVTSINDHSKVHFFSKCKIPTTLIDWGKNRENAELFYRSLDELVGLYKESEKPIACRKII